MIDECILIGLGWWLWDLSPSQIDEEARAIWVEDLVELYEKTYGADGA